MDANRHVKEIKQADFVLNTPFAFIRTLSANTFKRVSYDISSDQIDHFISPIKQYTSNEKSRPNIVLVITESFSREYSGAFNKDRNIENYVSYTPFIDSLAGHSLIFPNAFANGYKSIHGMSSVLAGIPSFKDAFTSSPYSKQEIESVVSILNELDYDTSFFHGAANGSMGFLGFSNILGFDIKIDGNMANAWTPYEFWFDGNFSHCGINSFQLIKEDKTWKIIYLVDTRRKKCLF